MVLEKLRTAIGYVKLSWLRCVAQRWQQIANYLLLLHVHARVSIGEAPGCQHVLGCEAHHGTPEAFLSVCSMFVKR